MSDCGNLVMSTAMLLFALAMWYSAEWAVIAAAILSTAAVAIEAVPQNND